MVSVRELGTDVRRGFHVSGNDLETAGNRAGIGAETVRETVVTFMARGIDLKYAVEELALNMLADGYGNWRTCGRRARQLVRLAYLGS